MHITRRFRLGLELIAVALLLAVTFAPPAAHAGALTDYAENKLVDNLVRGQANALPATWHLAFGTNTCTDSGSPTEPAGGAYARKAVTASLANFNGTQGTTAASSGTGGTVTNAAEIAWTESTASWGTLQSVWWMDAASAGNAWICQNLTAPFAVSGAGITVRFPVTTLQFQMDN